MSIKEIKFELNKLKDSEKAKQLQRYFKTGPGEYGEGDIFIGVRVPVLRKLANKVKDISLIEVKSLLESKIHEERFISLIILIKRFKKASEEGKKEIFNFYLNNSKKINNWDLVDVSAEHIIGAYLADKNKNLLYDLAKSENIWQRRIAMLSTFHYIKQNFFEESLEIAKILLNDKEDLIHKAVGWMLREIGKRDMEIELNFLKSRYQKMPRVMLRYAIEKFPDDLRKEYLKGEI